MLRQLEEQSVLLNLDTGNFYGLDDVGTRLYVLLVSSPSLEAAFEAALREYDVAPGTLHDDIVALATRLVEEGLLEVHDDRPTP